MNIHSILNRIDYEIKSFLFPDEYAPLPQEVAKFAYKRIKKYRDGWIKSDYKPIPYFQVIEYMYDYDLQNAMRIYGITIKDFNSRDEFIKKIVDIDTNPPKGKSDYYSNYMINTWIEILDIVLKSLYNTWKKDKIEEQFLYTNPDYDPEKESIIFKKAEDGSETTVVDIINSEYLRDWDKYQEAYDEIKKGLEVYGKFFNSIGW